MEAILTILTIAQKPCSLIFIFLFHGSLSQVSKVITCLYVNILFVVGILHMKDVDITYKKTYISSIKFMPANGRLKKQF